MTDKIRSCCKTWDNGNHKEGCEMDPEALPDISDTIECLESQWQTNVIKGRESEFLLEAAAALKSQSETIAGLEAAMNIQKGALVAEIRWHQRKAKLAAEREPDFDLRTNRVAMHKKRADKIQARMDRAHDQISDFER